MGGGEEVGGGKWEGRGEVGGRDVEEEVSPKPRTFSFHNSLHISTKNVSTHESLPFRDFSYLSNM